MFMRHSIQLILRQNTLKQNFASGKKIPRPQHTNLDRQGNPIQTRAADPLLTEQIEHTYNVNVAENPDWFRKIQQAKERRSILEEVKEKSLLTRRQRKVFDRPRIDTDQTNYLAWREYVNLFEKHQYMGYKIHAQLKLSPKWLLHALGEGLPAFRNGKYAMREWDFMDSNLDRFLLYDFKGSTLFWGDNLSEEDQERYEKDQLNKRPKDRIYKKMTPEEFWASEEKQIFHVNATHYGNAYKFGTWLENLIEEKRQEEQSYEQKVVSELGAFNFYNQYDQEYENFKEPTVFKYDRSYYEEGKSSEAKAPKQGKKQGKEQPAETVKKGEYYDKIVPKVKLGEEFRV